MFKILPIAILGWAAGACVNYLSDVLPVRRRFVSPFCLECESPQKWMNYFMWPRKCNSCGHIRPLRTWIVEVIYIGAAILLWMIPPPSLGFVLGLILLIYLGTVTVIDLEYRVILHPVSLAGAALGLFVGTRLHGFGSTLIGGAAGFGLMLFLYYLGSVIIRLLARLRGETYSEEALGFGDVNLSGVLGLLLGWPGIIIGLILTILLAGAVSFIYFIILVAVRRYRPNVAIPYGPFLVSSAVALLYFRDFIFF